MTAIEQRDTKSEYSFTRLIGTGIAGKLLVDTGVQMFNPYLQIFSHGLGINVIVLGRMIGVRSAMGIFAPIFGGIADRHGYRRILQLGLLLNAIGLLLIGSSNGFWMVLLGMIFAGLGMSSFTPTLHAYLSHRLPYSIRARGLGMIEYSWALTGIIGLFLMGLLIEEAGWRTPFFVLAVGMVLMTVVFDRLPSARTPDSGASLGTERSLPPVDWRQIRSFLDLGPNRRSAYANMVAGSLIFFAGMQIMVMYGVWLGSEYGLTAAQLGLVALVFGLFDLAASVSVSIFTDRIGKRRSVMIGTVVSILGYLLLPVLNIGLVIAVIAIGLTRAAFEFAIVANFPLLSEQVPDKRGKVMTLSAAVGLMGASLASFTAPPLYALYGVAGMTMVSAIAAAMAFMILLLFVREIHARRRWIGRSTIACSIAR